MQPMHDISALCREFGVTPRTLRFYEDKGLLAPGRAGGRRVYSARDRARLKLILQGRRFGFALDEMRELIALHDLGDQGRTQARRTIALAERRLAEMVAQRAELDAVIAELRALIARGRMFDEAGPERAG
ncbi:MAG: MerR family transcriptional regulator [Paracoccaceae bacterium]|nr:MAG: MerR family DNA-binding transcriptional regulator [Alphaproteobacteria bacterium]GIX15100.1 MAG: MerR family transcriptional regulator [Paracoccaceae bacterium]